MDYFNQETERLQFRQLTEDDIESWLVFFDNNDSLHFLGIDLTQSKEALAKDWVLTQLKRYKESGLGHLAIIEKESGTFIGMGGIIPRDLSDKKEFEIAYSLIPAYWGKGYATELARQLKAFGFEHKIANRFVSIIHKENIRSIHVAKKNNMTVLFETEYLEMPVYVYGLEVFE